MFDQSSCSFTDDTVLTIAVAKSIVDCRGDYSKLSDITIKNMQSFGRKYPNVGYGGRFKHWVQSNDPKPYHSFGNGAAMRVSACGIYGNSIEEVKMLAEEVTKVTHNHPEGLKAAEVTAICIFMARQGESKDKIKKYASKYYDIDFSLEMIRDFYEFDVTCQGTMPVALVAFFDSIDFEDAIKNAVSVGGDSDTIAAITGSIAEQYYSIPNEIKEKSISYLDDFLSLICSFN